MTTTNLRADWPDSQSEEVFLPPVEEAKSMATDPNGFMACALSRAKWWLPRCGDLLAAYDALQLSGEYFTEVKRRGYSKPVLLDAEEIVRRAEHRLGTIIIDGQDAGIFTSPNNLNGISLVEILGLGKRYARVNALRNPGRISRMDFEVAVELARGEGIMTKANITRLVDNEELTSDRSEWQRGKRRVDSNKIISTLADQLDALRSGLNLVDPRDLDDATKLEAIESISDSLAFMKKEMKKW